MVRVGRCISFGRSKASRGRNIRKRPAPLQAKGPARGHYQRGEKTLFLLEAGREATGQAGAGPQTKPEEVTPGSRINNRRRRDYGDPAVFDIPVGITGQSGMAEFQDRVLKCVDCGADFVFTAGEQHFFHDKNFKNEPKRCKACKTKRQGARRPGALPKRKP